MTIPRAQPSSLGGANATAGAALRSGGATSEGPFVINLCSSTTPVALSQPQDSELKRFTFFVSRRLEDGRERFRLHMGFFETLQVAEEWLSVVREVYPGAWAGEAPGKRLHPRPEPLARAMEASAPSPPVAKPAAASRPQPIAARPSSPAPAASATSAGVAPARSQPATPSAPAARPAAARPAAAPTVRAAPTARAAPTVRAAPSKTRPTRPEPPTLFPAVRPVSSTRAAPATPAPAPVRSKPSAPPAAAARGAGAPMLSNVREVLRALDETGSTKQMPAVESKPARASEPALSDSQVVKLLETRRFDAGHAPDDSSIAVLKPDDTGTRRELKEAVASNAPVSFAVQLQWSVQPIEIGKVPPLAIFSAYTLYTVEGSREGRRWYGLRLGFFTDALSAKQVAQYVRSEFASVAVVPVSAQERNRASATDKNGKAKSQAPAPILEKLPAAAEFKLLDEVPTPPVPAAAAAAASATAAAKEKHPALEAGKQPGKPGAAAAQKRSSGKTPGRVRAREKRSPQTLEETLEILGADELEIEDGSGQSLSDTGVRHLMMQVRKESPFTKLLDRLSERTRKGR